MARLKSGWRVASCRVISRGLPAALFLALSWALPGRAEADWTLMVYLDGDNNLEGAAIDDFIEMALVGGDSSVNVVVQFDRAPGHVGTWGDWKTCKRFCVTTGTLPRAADEVADIGEANMGDPTTLTAFINWAATDYPAARYALVLWNHGNGWMTKGDPKERPVRRPYKYVCLDETNDSDALELREVASALDAASVNIDLLGFDACLMGMVEVAYELRDAGPTGAPEVIVFSEDSEAKYGWPYEEIIRDLKAATTPLTPTELASSIIDRFYEDYIAREVIEEKDFPNTMSAVNVSELQNLGVAIDTLSDELIANWSAAPASVKIAAQAVIDSLADVVIYELHDDDYMAANGLTVYFPSLLANLDPEYDAAALDFAADTLWGDFLLDFHTSSMIGSWVCDARRNVQEFTEDSCIDLYDFCDRLVNHAVGAYYVDFIPHEMTGFAGTAQNWKKDDECWEIDPLPFPFTFFGQTYTKVWVSSNGFLDFGAAKPDTETEWDNSTEKLRNSARIAPLWVDLDTTNGDIYRHGGTDALGTYFCIRWEAEDRWTAKSVVFEALLYEDGYIKFNYDITDWWTIDDPPVYNGLSWAATVGISAGDEEHWELSLYDHVWYQQTDESDLYTPCAPDLTSFDADKATIAYGETVTLTWVTADMVSVSIDNGVGGDLPLSGSADDTPSATVTYTLTAVDPLGNPYTQSVTVTVERLTLTYPTGGEMFLSDGTTVVNITWTSSEITGQVKIEFDDGGGYVLLDTVDDTGSYDWTVPDEDHPAWALPANPPICRVKISDAVDGSPLFESAAFSILSDTDSDGMPDSWEFNYSLDDPNGHADGDTLTNLQEYLAGTDPTNPDTDGDSLPDDWEVQYTNGIDQLLPTVANSDGIGPTDDDEDDDGDSLTNVQEYLAGTDPTKWDTDGDNLPDDWELQYTNGIDQLLPTVANSDGIGPTDDDEDDDGDGRTNLWEYLNGCDPTDPLSPPPKGSTSKSGCAVGGGGSAAGFACLVLALAAFKRRSVTA